MTDSGHYAHPFFTARGTASARRARTGRRQPAADEVGHGTAESANLFASRRMSTSRW